MATVSDGDGQNGRPHRGSWTSPGTSFGELKGYLRKRSRAKRWQRRFFEANDYYLTYYKSQNSDKLLACIDLRQVTKIDFGNGTPEAGPGEFYIELAGRIYVMKAKTYESAKEWVEGLRQRKSSSAADSSNSAEVPRASENEKQSSQQDDKVQPGVKTEETLTSVIDLAVPHSEENQNQNQEGKTHAEKKGSTMKKDPNYEQLQPHDSPRQVSQQQQKAFGSGGLEKEDFRFKTNQNPEPACLTSCKDCTANCTLS